MKTALRSLLGPLSFLAICLLATSCATFPKGELPKASATHATPAKTGKKVPLTYSFTAGSNLTGTRVETGGVSIDTLEGAFKSAAEKNGGFSSVRKGKGGAVHVDVDMLNHGNATAAYISGFLSGFTFTAIPAIASDNYTVTARARSASGRTKKYTLDDGVTTVIWLPMIFAMATNHPAAVMPAVQENMYLTLFQQMEKDGF